MAPWAGMYHNTVFQDNLSFLNKETEVQQVTHLTSDHTHTGRLAEGITSQLWNCSE